MSSTSSTHRPLAVALLVIIVIGLGIAAVFCRAPAPLPSTTPTPTTVAPVVPTSAQPHTLPTPTLQATPLPLPDPAAETAGIYKPSPALRSTGCQYQHASNGAILPDPTCTTGATDPRLTASVLCASGFTTKPYRDGPLAMPAPVTESVRLAAFAAYGVTQHTGLTHEVDHLIPLEDGGDDDAANLWPQPAQPVPGFHEKDAVENWVRVQICAHPDQLADFQRGLATDWTQYLQRAQSAAGIVPKQHDTVTGDELD